MLIFNKPVKFAGLYQPFETNYNPKKMSTFIFVTCLLFLVAHVVAEEITHATTLHSAKCDDLIFDNVDLHAESKYSAPRVPVDVDVKVVLMSVNDISDIDETVSMTARIEFRWTDPRYAISDTSCSGERIVLNTKNIWYPHFIIQNGASHVLFKDAWESFPVMLHENGYVDWRVAFNLHVNCDMNFHLFPFDTQHCLLNIQAPLYELGEVNFTVGDAKRGIVAFTNDIDHSMFAVAGQKVLYPTTVPGITFGIKLERKVIYYIWTIAIPLIAVIVLTVSAFVVPADGEEKMGTIINAELSFFLLYLLFVDALPATSDNLPMLMVYFTVQIILTTICVIVCAVICRMIEKEVAKDDPEDEMPEPLEPVSAVHNHHHHQHKNRVTPSAISERSENSTISHQDVKPTKVDGKSIKSYFKMIKARHINEGILAFYIFSVLLTTVVFCAYIGSLYHNQPEADNYSPIELYIHNE